VTDAPAWNLLVTAIEGQRDALRAAMAPLVRLRRAGYPNVLVAAVDDPRAFLDRVAAAYATSPALRAALGKVVPVDRPFRFGDAPAFVDTAAAVLESELDRLRDATFFVRVVRRGFRGALESTAAERELGARLVAALTVRGGAPRVRFADPDVAILIETVRDEAGVAFVDRALRTAHPYVRVR
jgi:tRNA(Ser,Leu) C12 N-acetylase TAN1